MRLRSIVAVLGLAAVVFGPAEAAHSQSVRTNGGISYRFTATFREGSTYISVTGLVGGGAWVYGPNPHLSSDTDRGVCVYASSSKGSVYGCSELVAVSIDPALQSGIAVGTFTSSGKSYTVAVAISATGAPNVSSGSSNPPNAGVSASVWRPGAPVGSVTTSVGSVTGLGEGSLSLYAGAGSSVST